MVSPGSLFKSPKNVRTSPGKKRVFSGGHTLKSLHSALTRTSAAKRELENVRKELANFNAARNRRVNNFRRNLLNERGKIENKLKKMERLYTQLARRVIYQTGTRNLNNSPLTQREKENIRVSAQIIKNMTSARRTVRRLSVPRNIEEMIIRSAARR